MAIKTQLAGLLQKEMDRKDFLKYGGSLILAVIGVTGFMRILLSAHDEHKQVGATSSAKNTSVGYGSSTYGG